jgi:adenylate kinase family enzyme
VKRVIVIGSSGAGKTTLAKELSARLSIPHVELDSLYHRANWQPAGDEEFLASVRVATSGDAWVLCGNYYSKIGQEIWPQADTIVWCNYSFPRVFWQLLRRTLTRGVVRAELWNGNRERLSALFTKDSIIMWMLQNWKKQNARYEQMDRDSLFPASLVRLKNPKDRQDFLARIGK